MSTIANLRIARAGVEVAERLRARNLMSSDRVQIKALSLNATGSVEQETLPVIFYRVKGESKDHYMVVLKLHARDGQVVDWECACPAGQHDQTCAHAMAAIVRAHLDGHLLRL